MGVEITALPVVAFTMTFGQAGPVLPCENGERLPYR